MQKIQCMGCQTSFKDNQKLILENLTTQYKNFHLPLKDDKARWTILKTIVSFLNSQGGTIYIGIEDSQGAVQGVFLERKEMDNFKLFMKHLIEKIYPKVDLNNKQEVVIQFVPVLKDHEFEGKYVVKIIVQQGDPSQVYFFGEKIKLEGANNKIDEFQNFYAYERHNMGGTTQIKGLKLLETVHSRAKNPNKTGNTFHEGCNPEPPHLQLQIRKIYFSKTSIEHMKMLEASFKEYFQKENIDYECEYLKEERTICLSVDEENDFKLVQTFLTEHIDYLNNDIFKGEEINLEVKGERQNYFLIQNNPKSNKKAHKESKQEKSHKKEEKESKESKNTPKFNYKYKQQVQKPKQKVQQIPRVISESPKKATSTTFTKKYGFTLTHIEPKAAKQLESYLRNNICRNIQKNIIRFINTVQVFLNNEQDYTTYVDVLYQKASKLAAFGFKGEIRAGKNSGNLRICNYDKNKRNQMADELQMLMGDEIKELKFDRDERNNFSLLCKLKDKSNACQWLDSLLQSRILSKYSNHGSNSKNGRVFKLKIYLEMQ